MKFLSIIPSRYHSSRFEGKPLVDIFGLPMVVRVYRRALKVFDDVVIATDDERIEEVAKAYNCNVIMTSKEHRSGTDRCAEVIGRIKQFSCQQFDVVVNIQGDEPFVHIEQLNQIKDCFENDTTKIATLIKQFAKTENIFNPNSPKVVVDSNFNAIYFSRSPIPYQRDVDPKQWQESHPYYKHIGLYAYRTSVLLELASLSQGILERCESLEQLRWIEAGYQIKCVETTVQSYCIDTVEDLNDVLKNYKDDQTD